MEVQVHEDGTVTMTLVNQDELIFVYQLLNCPESTAFNEYKAENNLDVPPVGWEIWKQLDRGLIVGGIDIWGL